MADKPLTFREAYRDAARADQQRVDAGGRPRGDFAGRVPIAVGMLTVGGIILLLVVLGSLL